MRCFKPCWGCVGLVMALVSMLTAQAEPVGTDTSLLEQTERAVADAKARGLLTDEVLQRAQHVDAAMIEELSKLTQQAAPALQQAQEEAMTTLGVAPPNAEQALANQIEQRQRAMTGKETAILVSFSMPESLLIDLMRTSAESGTPLYINGMLKGTTNLKETLVHLQKLAAKADVTPNIAVNPLMFEEHEVSAVPAVIIREGDATGIMWGVLDLAYVEAQFQSAKKAGATTDLGVNGQTFPVAEKSLIVEMKERLAKVDWQGKQQAAIAGYWRKHQFNELPRATETSTWYIDPTIRVKSDITNAKGEVLARAGEVFNPIRRTGVTMTYLVVDGRDEQQVAWAKEQVRVIRGMFQIMLSGMDTQQDGWLELARLRKEFGAPVFMLPREAVTRFQVGHVPVRVDTTPDAYLKVTEVALDAMGKPIPERIKANAKMEGL